MGNILSLTTVPSIALAITATRYVDLNFSAGDEQKVISAEKGNAAVMKSSGRTASSGDGIGNLDVRHVGTS